MAEEFNTFLAEAKKSPIEEKVNAFGDIVEKIMSIVLRIPDLVDQSLNGLNQKISNVESRINTLNSDLASLKARGGVASLGAVGPKAPGTPPPPPGGPPGVPPGTPPPPPGGPPGGPGGGRPASPVSLRGAILGELKQLFAKKQGG